MYGFDVSGIIEKLAGSVYWGAPFYILKYASCGFLYSVDLKIKYGSNSIPSPSLTDHLVIIAEGQKLSCKANLEGYWGSSHPVHCKITDSAGAVVLDETKWLSADDPSYNTWTDMFSDLSLPVGVYDIAWSVCTGSASHSLTVHSLDAYTTNDVDVNVVVTSTSGLDPYSAWDAIESDVAAQMTVYNATLMLKSAETVGSNLVVFHLEVTAPVGSTAGVGVVITVSALILAAIIAAIAIALVAIPAWTNMKIAEYSYNVTTMKFLTPDGKYLYYDDYVGYMATNYPDVWDEIKDYIVPPTPPPSEPDFMTYLTYAVIAIFGLAGLYVSIKYVFPALKGR